MKQLWWFVVLLVGCGGGSPPLSVSSPTPGTMTISWNAPTMYVDGTAIPAGAIAGYQIDYGTSPTNLSTRVMVMGGPVSTRVTGLPPATYYVTARTVGSTGETSAPAGPVSGVVR